jgi:GTP-binding protein Era
LFLCIPKFLITMHKAGFINIIGNPNVGKSTLMNQLVGERLSIITSKAQTTRHRILGIVNGDNFQMVFSDTPGIIKAAYKLHEGMMNFVQSAMRDADIFLLMTDIYEKELNDETILEKLRKTKRPLLILINKMDEADEEKLATLSDTWKALLPNAELLPISALHDFNIDKVLERIRELLPASEAFYPKDALTDKPERFFVSEMIREQIFTTYKKEVPYSCEVEVESFKESEDIIRIMSIIYVARESQKGILIGHQGGKLKKVGTGARKAMEEFFDKKVFLEMLVKVDKDWRNKEDRLKRYGYFNS